MTAYIISSGVVSSGLALAAGDTATVLFGGKTVSTADAGLETVLSGGSAAATTVSKGGELILSSGAVASGLIVSKGGVVSRGGLIIGATVDYGVISGAQLGGSMTVEANGESENVTVASGGVETVVPLGLAALATVASGGVLVDDAVARHTVVQAGGVISGTGKLTSNTLDGGVIEGVLVLGALKVTSGGVISAASIVSGASAVVSAGGQAIAVTVSSGASETVLSGAVATNAVVSSGAVVIDDGSMIFSAGGAVPFSGALSGSGALTQTGSGVVEIGGATSAFTGVLKINGGTAALASSEGIGGGQIVFTAPAGGSATLKINAADQPAAGATFATTISNFDEAGESLYMASLVFSSGATAQVSGSTLKVTDGAAVYDFKLAGSAATAYSVVSGPLGGVLVKAAGHPVALVQAMAAFAAPPAAPAPAAAGPHEPVISVAFGGSAAGSGWRAH